MARHHGKGRRRGALVLLSGGRGRRRGGACRPGRAGRGRRRRRRAHCCWAGCGRGSASRQLCGECLRSGQRGLLGSGSHWSAWLRRRGRRRHGAVRLAGRRQLIDGCLDCALGRPLQQLDCLGLCSCRCGKRGMARAFNAGLSRDACSMAYQASGRAMQPAASAAACSSPQPHLHAHLKRATHGFR